jgi:hypothetical protein
LRIRSYRFLARTVAVRIRLALALLALTASAVFAAEHSARPANWAVAAPKPISGLPNFYSVTPNLYRGAQPTAEGMRALEAMGVKTVLSLRAFNDDTARASAHPLQDLASRGRGRGAFPADRH